MHTCRAQSGPAHPGCTSLGCKSLQLAACPPKHTHLNPSTAQHSTAQVSGHRNPAQPSLPMERTTPGSQTLLSFAHLAWALPAGEAPPPSAPPGAWGRAASCPASAACPWTTPAVPARPDQGLRGWGGQRRERSQERGKKPCTPRSRFVGGGSAGKDNKIEKKVKKNKGWEREMEEGLPAAQRAQFVHGPARH